MEVTLEGRKGCNLAIGLPHPCMELIGEILENSIH